MCAQRPVTANFSLKNQKDIQAFGQNRIRIFGIFTYNLLEGEFWSCLQFLIIRYITNHNWIYSI